MDIVVLVYESEASLLYCNPSKHRPNMVLSKMWLESMFSGANSNANEPYPKIVRVQQKNNIAVILRKCRF